MPNEMIVETAKESSIKQIKYEASQGGAARSANQSPLILGEKS
jgi:hypothetical protein